MASIYWIGTTDGGYATAANWFGGAIPTTGDHVRLIAEYAADITTNLNQSAVAIGEFVVESGNESDIGTIAGYLQIDPNLFEFSGGGTAFIDISAAAIPAIVNSTKTPVSGERGLYLIGSGITTLAVQSGYVGLAAIQGTTATAATVRTISNSANLICGAGCTLTTADCLGGQMRIRANVTTLNVYGGEVWIEEDAAVTTVNVYGGTVHHNSTGTVTTWNARGGLSDWLTFAGARTVTDMNIYGGAGVRFNKANVTHTNAPVLIDTMEISTTLFRG